MSKLRTVAYCVMLPVLFTPSQNEKFTKYKPVEAYEVRPGVLMMPSYAEDGQVCAVGLEARHYSPEVVRVNPSLSPKEIEQLLGELAPVDERGPKVKGLAGDQISLDGNALVTSSEYENVTVWVYSSILPNSKPRRIVADDVAVKIQWNHRKCR